MMKKLIQLIGRVVVVVLFVMHPRSCTYALYIRRSGIEENECEIDFIVNQQTCVSDTSYTLSTLEARKKGIIIMEKVLSTEID